MVQYLGKYKQNIVVDMRKKGFSYSEIRDRVNIPKSTISYWVKGVKLTSEQIKKLNDNRIKSVKANALKKISKTKQTIEEIKSSSSKDVKGVSKKELWLMGIILYWKNGNKNDLKKGVHFSSSDPSMIRLFLKWLREVGGVNNDEIKFDIFIKGKDKKIAGEAIEYWSKISGFPKDYFKNIYFQKDTKKGKNSSFLRIKVAKSSMLARQIAGWIEGLKNLNNV